MNTPYDLTPHYLGIKIQYYRGIVKSIPNYSLWERSRGYYLHNCDTNKTYKESTDAYQKEITKYAYKKEILDKLKVLESHWKVMHGKSFDESFFNYKLTDLPNNTERLFGKWENLIEVPNTHTGKKHHFYNGKDYDSKSEADIAKIYDELDIPVKHAAKIEIGMKFSSKPDFFPYIRERGKYLIHEHLGRMGDPDYVEDNLLKMKKYSNLGLIPGRDILYTFEDELSPGNFLYYKSQIAGFINANL